MSEATYNGDGDRVSLTTYALGNAQTTTYFTVKGEVLVTSNDQANQYQLFGQGLVGQYQEGQWHYFLHDGQASVRTIVDETGEVINQQDYRPFGGPLSSDGQYESQFGFLGAQVDRLSGLLYVGGRYYDPVTGRFLTPAHSGTNPYSPLPVMWLLLPGLGLLLWRGRRDGSWRVVMLVCVFGFYITGCQGEPISTPSPLPVVGVTPPQIPTHTGTPTETVTNTPLPPTNSWTPQPPTYTYTPSSTPTLTPCPTPSDVPSHLPSAPAGWEWRLLPLDAPGTQFNITHYVTTRESNYPIPTGEAGVILAGVDLQRNVSLNFFTRVMLQGSGYLELGTGPDYNGYVSYNYRSNDTIETATFRRNTCAETANQSCAVALQTGAVSPNEGDRIAMGVAIYGETPSGERGTKVYLESLDREIVLNDTGGDVTKNQIDVYVGLEGEGGFPNQQSIVWGLFRIE